MILENSSNQKTAEDKYARYLANKQLLAEQLPSNMAFTQKEREAWDLLVNPSHRPPKISPALIHLEGWSISFIRASLIKQRQAWVDYPRRVALTPEQKFRVETQQTMAAYLLAAINLTNYEPGTDLYKEKLREFEALTGAMQAIEKHTIEQVFKGQIVKEVSK